jgi:hypothetical protein
MNRMILAAVGLGAILVALWVVAANPFGRAQAATFHVDFDHGKDNSNGLTAATAWKHAPGDPNATGASARASLRAGDVIRFASKVRYRGEIVVSASGTDAAPIVFSSDEPAGNAVIDGSEPVQVEPCHAAADCAGSSRWQHLVRITSAAPLTEESALFTGQGPMRPAQAPDPQDAFYRDEMADMLEVDGVAMSQGRVQFPHDIAVTLRAGEGRLALWVKPNRVVYRPITGMDGDIALFDPGNLQYYPAARAAALGSVGLVDQPGEFAVLPDGKTAIAMLPPAATWVSVASGRAGFKIKGGAHLTFRNLTFENFADGGAGAPAGVAIFSDKPPTSNIVIDNNWFRNFSSPAGQGPLIIRNVTDLRVADNKFETIALGSAMRLAGGGHIVVENNDIRRVGRTGIMLMGVDDALVQHNRISDVKGVHGNGVSAYLDNHNIRFLANTITDAKQPATFQGAADKGTGDNNILFANNLLVATPTSIGSLISFAKLTRGVTIRNNVIIGGKLGLRLDGRDTGVIIADNVVNGMAVGGGGLPSDWTLAGNEWTSLSSQQIKGGRKGPSPIATAANQIAEGKVSDVLCEVIKRSSVPPAPGAATVAGSIGAGLRCP